MPMGDFFEVQCKFADKFNPLKLTDGEIGLLTGAIIMNAGQCSLLWLLVKVTLNILQCYRSTLYSLYTDCRNAH